MKWYVKRCVFSLFHYPLWPKKEKRPTTIKLCQCFYIPLSIQKVNNNAELLKMYPFITVKHPMNNNVQSSEPALEQEESQNPKSISTAVKKLHLHQTLCWMIGSHCVSCPRLINTVIITAACKSSWLHWLDQRNINESVLLLHNESHQPDSAGGC